MTPSTSTYRFPPPTLAHRVLGAGARALVGSGLAKLRLESESLMENARRRTGLSDFGDDDFRDGLETLLRAYREEANLTPLGRLIVWMECRDALVQRLLIRRDLTRFPEIADERVEGPIVVCGMPRTGTTLLHRLLAQDPAARGLTLWEGRTPAPAPGVARGTNWRVPQAHLTALALDLLAPDFKIAHPVTVEGPEECLLIFQMTFAGLHFAALADIPSYISWFRRKDMRPAYAYYREVLKLLQFRRPPKRWALKTPQHMPFMDLLIENFPNVRIVHTHRDPLEVIPSACSLMCLGRAICSDHVDPLHCSAAVMGEMTDWFRTTIESRDRLPQDRILDVRYRELVRDPIATVRKIYAYFDVEFTEAAESAMRDWIARNPQNKHGKHKYSLADFGLTREEVVERMKFYTERFEV